MPRDKDFGRKTAIGISQNNLTHARNVLLAQGNTAGYSSNDTQHTRALRSDYNKDSVKAQSSGPSRNSTYADTLRPSGRKYVDSILNNRPNVLNVPDSKSLAEGKENNKKVTKDNLKWAGYFLASVMVANQMIG